MPKVNDQGQIEFRDSEFRNAKKEIQEKAGSFIGSWVFLALAALILFIVGWTFLTVQVPAGNIGVKDTFGQVDPDGFQAGFHLKSPITRVVFMSIQTQKYSTTATSASQDLQDVSTEITLNYHLSEKTIPELYKNLGFTFEDRVIQPAVQESVKAITAKFNATELITERATVKTQIEADLKERLAVYNIATEAVSITDFKFSAEFNAAIEAKVKAEQDALKAENDLRRIKVEKEQTITKAEAQNERVKLEADAKAYQVKVQGEAEAYALSVVSEELKKSNDLISYKSIEKWNGVMPLYYGSGQIVPFLNIGGN